ncbi:phospholipase D1 isoform X2 [Tribolium madens]|nr:phospholipase D1 isoform X2 [Tribolium madens]XP_044253874.1 phospholipase D1 isoform X2 [Tribolium madens]
MEEEESGECNNDLSLTRPSLGGSEYDDELGIPESLSIVDVGDGPVLIEHSDEEIDDDVFDGLPFSSIHKPPIKFKSFRRNVFIPSLDISVTIKDYERNLTTHMLNPNLYTISLVHGTFNWQIKKRYKQIQHLHQQLILFRAGLNIPFPSKTHKRKRKSFKMNVPEAGRGKRKAALPRFPKKPEILVPYEKLGDRIKQLENYLNNLLSINIYRNHPATIEFLEVSHLSFVQGLGIKGKEGVVKKRTGSTQPGQAGCNCCGLIRCMFCIRCQHLCNDILCARWNERWFFIKDTCFGYINPEDGMVKCVILFDQGFEVASGLYSIGLQTGFQIQTLSRQIAFKCWTRRKGREWIETLKEVASGTARDFTQANQHRSFAPLRTTIAACWFIDGASYMSAVADAIENAKEEVFITDWWLSPEIYMKRPALSGDYWRLDKLLQRKAASGVRIFVLLYKEVELALGLNSYYSKQTLAELSENIKVLRHPDHARVGVFLWAHHEKMVVVDQTYAFVGGIDLCYGRWDDAKHRGKDAILNRLQEAGIEDPTDYISFYGLRNHSTLNCEPITELIYVHSKLMIVDDKTVVCGSANINDRSLIGKRDSEIAVLIEDEAFDDGVMNGKKFPCGKFAGSLRKYLFKEHLGLLGKENEMIDFDITDPISDFFYKEIWHKTASLNTEFYEKVFHCIPTDKVRNFADLKKNQEEKPLYINEISRAEKMLESIQGHLVLLPLHFLCQESLTPAASSVEGMMPTSLWT